MVDSYYVASPEPPSSRKPPLGETGILAWLRRNLFSSALNSFATIITAGLLLWFLWEILTWTVHSAQWSVVYNNLRLISVGQYDRDEYWRIDIVAAILVFLTGLSLGIWARVVRSVLVMVIVLLAIMVIIPLIGSRIPEPTIHTLIESKKSPASFVFTGYDGQDVSFEIEPLTTADALSQTRPGYFEANGYTTLSTEAAAARADQAPRDYNLVLTLRLLDGSGRPIEGVPPLTLGPDNPGGKLSATLPKDGWYILEITRDDEANPDGSVGLALLSIDGVEIFTSQETVAEARVEEFGPQPDLERMQLAQQKDFRFLGTQSFSEFISLQVSPMLHNLTAPFVIGILLFANGWVIGTLGRRERNVRRASLAGWLLSLPVIVILLTGFSGSRTLPPVDTSIWGGLMLTIILTFVGITASFPLGILLALGRRSDLPVVKIVCTLLIEVIRGVPLITILFMAKLIVPFFWDRLADLDLTLRLMIGLTLFSAAYLAENIRGGLQIIPPGQIEAARALGMNPFLTTVLIVLPQALRAVIPAIVGQFISLFKDTSLVALVGLFELVGIVDIIVSGQPVYRPYQREAYIFVAIVYFVISYAMSDVSRRLETSGAGSVRKL
jgi:His/Glu/Gln/Arg/opine family amino acid ABC transporter permease subunit